MNIFYSLKDNYHDHTRDTQTRKEIEPDEETDVILPIQLNTTIYKIEEPAAADDLI